MFDKNLKEYDYKAEELETFNYAKLSTKNGDIYLKLFTDEVTNTVSNFVFLAKDGFYDGLKFHRVIEGFMAQGGCPDGTGAGSPAWSISCECDKNIHKHEKGTLSMAHAGRDTGGSQFFICFVACPHLDGEHTVFGSIEEGDDRSFEVLDNIKMNDEILKIEILAKRD